MNERVRELRKSLKLTLEKFGAKLGVGKTAISKIEKGENNLTGQMFLAICREYNVNPLWLEKGEGPMFLEVSKEDEYTKAASELSSDPLVVSVLVEYHKLQPEERSIVRKYIKNILDSYKDHA